MRQRQAFLLILIHDAAEPAVLRGRVRNVADETETVFAGADQLIAFLQSQGTALPANGAAPASSADPAARADS